MHQDQFKNKIVLVTGAASGIGEAIAKAFLEQGAQVMVVDLDIVSLTECFSDYTLALPLEQDLTQEKASENIINWLEANAVRLDILVNNAGRALPGEIGTTTDEMWQSMMDINVTAMFRLTRKALPLLKESGAGRIINLGSIMSDMAGPNFFAYGTTKHAVAGMTKSMSVDLGKYGITANYLQPGAIVTALSKPFFDDEDFKKYWEGKAPVGRLGQPEDVAHAALFLASEKSSFITGVGLNIDGGAIVMF
jgi:NAD(P)-dependent dehydrogenase (short-subunit alcohol dehydrogenase family)